MNETLPPKNEASPRRRIHWLLWLIPSFLLLSALLYFGFNFLLQKTTVPKFTFENRLVSLKPLGFELEVPQDWTWIPPSKKLDWMLKNSQTQAILSFKLIRASSAQTLSQIADELVEAGRSRASSASIERQKIIFGLILLETVSWTQQKMGIKHWLILKDSYLLDFLCVAQEDVFTEAEHSCNQLLMEMKFSVK